jgi:hypothetical protein
MGNEGTHALLLLTLVRTDRDAGPAEAIGRFRVDLGSRFAEVASYDVIADDRWSGGGIDVVPFGTRGELAAGAATAATLRSRVPGYPAVSFRSFAVEVHEVRSPPVRGVHVFSSGGMAEGFDRMSWQARWRAHAALLTTTPTFAPYLQGYLQYHGVDADSATAWGVDDIHGIAHMTFRNLDDRATALELPEYANVLRPDEDQFVSRSRGMRVFASRAFP